MVKFRMAEKGDAARLAEINLPYVANTAVTFMYERPTEESFETKISTLTATYPFIVAEVDGRVEGYAYASALRPQQAYQWDVELTIYLDEKVQRHGLGTALYTRLLKVLTVQGFLNAYAAIALPNEPSMALHNRFGFQQVGYFPNTGYKLRQWRGVVWLCKTLGDFPAMPMPPTPLGKFVNHEAEVLLL